MFEGIAEWFGFWVRWRFSETVAKIGGVRWLRFAGMYDPKVIEFLMEMDLEYEGLKEKAKAQK